MLRARLLLIVLASLTAAGASPAAENIEFRPEVRVCAEGSGTIVKGSSCWVMDLKKTDSHYEYQFCLGLVVEGGILFAGGQGSAMLCGTLIVPVELAETRTEKDAWKKIAEQRVRALIEDPANRELLKKATGKAFKSVKILEFKQAPDDTKRANQEAIDKSTLVR